MRGAWFALTAGCAVVTVVMACTGSDPEPQREPDVTNNYYGTSSSGGSSSGGTSSGGTSGGGARTVHCPNGEDCSLPDQVCCVSDRDASTAHCTAKDACFGESIFACDTADDCASGQLCCGFSKSGPFWSASCVTPPANTNDCIERTICRSNDDCPKDAGAPYRCDDPGGEFFPPMYKICQ